ncbi:unnamed protein product [Schistosoma rodhaini]|nr:unnamed protein product [Schistosoma rodhaini]
MYQLRKTIDLHFTRIECSVLRLNVTELYSSDVSGLVTTKSHEFEDISPHFSENNRPHHQIISRSNNTTEKYVSFSALQSVITDSMDGF